VIDDLRDGYISRQAAESEYGLRCRDSAFEVDEAATREARLQMGQNSQIGDMDQGRKSFKAKIAG
jgi:hypothetical protein